MPLYVHGNICCCRRPHVLCCVGGLQKSYSRTRQRVNAPNKRIKDIHHFYPCMRCDRGLLKLRHHLCPCDLEKVKAKNIIRVSYGEGPRAGAPKPGRASANDEAPTSEA